jgi:hypothetical protein
MKNIRLYASGVAVLVLIYCGYQFFNWTVNRVSVDPGSNLMLRYKGPLIFGFRTYAQEGQFAKPAEGFGYPEIGVLEEMRGPGRHFYCPIWWERTIVKDLVVLPKSVAVVTSKLGDQLPPGEFLVDGDLGNTKFKGVMRRVFGPGRYRINSFAYEYKIIQTQETKVGIDTKTSGWVLIPTGYVGVQTYLTDNLAEKKKAGIQNEVLPAGLYAVNPRELAS